MELALYYKVGEQYPAILITDNSETIVKNFGKRHHTAVLETSRELGLEQKIWKELFFLDTFKGIIKVRDLGACNSVETAFSKLQSESEKVEKQYVLHQLLKRKELGLYTGDLLWEAFVNSFSLGYNSSLEELGEIANAQPLIKELIYQGIQIISEGKTEWDAIPDRLKALQAQILYTTESQKKLE